MVHLGISHKKWWRIFVKTFWRTALLSAMTILSIQPAVLFVPSVYAGAVPAAASHAKKKNKLKKLKMKKQKILKGRHVNHKHKPA